MLTEGLLALASVAGNAVVVAATTDAWETARRGYMRLLGRGDPRREQLAGQRLDETRDQLTATSDAELEPVRGALAERWARRLADLLEEDPAAEAELLALVAQVEAALPRGAVSAADHAVAAGGDVRITAQDRSVAAGVIHGNVAPPDPRGPGPDRG